MPRPSDGRASLLSLPAELRLHIYDLVFSSSTLFFASPLHFGPSLPKELSVTGLLSTCRTVFEETKLLWLNKCTFRFATTYRLLDVLTPLANTQTLASIRKIVLDKMHPPCYFKSEERERFYRWRFHEAFLLLPGLQLDLLVLGDCWHDHCLDWDLGWEEFGSQWLADVGTYKGVEQLIKHGNGWKELRVFSQTGTMFNFGSCYDGHNGFRYVRWQQPRQWQMLLDERDGRSSGPHVRIYERDDHHDAEEAFECALNESDFGKSSSQWQDFEQTQSIPGPGLDGMQGEIQNDAESEKQALIVVVRGGGVDYTQQDQELISREPELAGMTWPELKKNDLIWDPCVDLSAASY